MITELSRRCLAWYDQNARSLPWRGRSDPYAVWVSEIMLQQTRVESVIPYYERWMKRFPTLQALAEATQEEVLKYWEGLGYYSRARNLHAAAQQLCALGQPIPADRAGLERLAGVGRYTAGAIASIAFGLDEPALDGNIRRVLARVYALRVAARSPEGEHQLWDWCRDNLPPGRAGDFNQALMDLGAMVCTPRSPACLLCPIQTLCLAFQQGVQEELPVVKPRPEIPHYLVTAAVVWRDGRVMVARRPQHGLLGGMWEFPGGKVEAGETLPAALRREILEEMGAFITVGDELGVFEHAYTHFKVTLHAFTCTLEQGEPQPLEASALAWLLPDELSGLPMGKIDRQISRQIQRERRGKHGARPISKPA